ncbi:MAG: hypothetical protein NVSMB9_29790 [Isosphaeraceae bacterium]
MFDNRWENWAGDFADSFPASRFEASMRLHLPEILTHFGNAVRRIDRDFPDSVSPGTFASVMAQSMPRLNLPASVVAAIPEVVAEYLEYLQETGRVGEGSEWASQIRELGIGARHPSNSPAKAKGVTIRKPDHAKPQGRNDPCPCGSGKKYKKCCLNS